MKLRGSVSTGRPERRDFVGKGAGEAAGFLPQRITSAPKSNHARTLFQGEVSSRRQKVPAEHQTVRSFLFSLSLALVLTPLAQAQVFTDGLSVPGLRKDAGATQAQAPAPAVSPEQAQARAQMKAWGWSQNPVQPEPEAQPKIEEEPRRSRRSYRRSRHASAPARTDLGLEPTAPAAEEEVADLSRMSRRSRSSRRAQPVARPVQEAQEMIPALEETPRRSRHHASRRSVRQAVAAAKGAPPSPKVSAARERPAPAPASAPSKLSSDDKPIPGEKEARSWTAR